MRTIGLIIVLAAASVHAASDGQIEEVIVKGSVLESLQGAGSGSAVPADAVALVRATHPYEIFVRLPGVWISRGSEEENLTAIRSPVFAGPGSCGEFQVLENGIPIRPAGFCNVNNLFEIDTEQASSVEVLRGAGGALFGGNAVHGVINVVTGTEDPAAPARLSLEAGPWQFGQVRFSGGLESGGQGVHVDLVGTHADGYRDSTGHDEEKMVLTHSASIAGFDVTTLLSATNLDQETGGYVFGYKAYEGSIRKTNPNPESYRDAWAWRLSSRWQKTLDSAVELTVTPYARRSNMRFLQHFLPGEPLEDNGQTSAGVQAMLAGGESLAWRTGLVAEWASGDLYEYQAREAQGSAFVRATRPVGKHYDYDVQSLMGAVFYDLRWAFTDTLALVQGGRLEWLRYDYDNHMLTGNTKDDGTPCPAAVGCLYTRPADRDDAFTNGAGRLGLEWSVSEAIAPYALVASGFRPPQATELYRLQSGQTVADLDSERVLSFEVGAKGRTGALHYTVATFSEESRDLLLRDANGYNINKGEIDSRGIETELAWTLSSSQSLHLALSYARHEYAFDRVLAQSETIRSGNDVDTAPRWLGSLQWRLAPSQSVVSELELVYLGEYYANAENTARYPGHKVVNWRGSWQVNPTWRLFARVVNLFDEEYADRADWVFRPNVSFENNYRYFPAMPLQVYAGVEVTL